jgi:transketolase
MGKSEMVATRDVYGKTLVEMGRENKNIVVLDADLSGSTKTAAFGKAYPDRFFNMGIAEANMMGFAAGLALSGKTVFASSFAMFATLRPFEQIRNSIAAQNCNVKIVATHSGISVGEDGMSHQSIEDIAIMRALPNMNVFVPADGPSTAFIIREATRINGPVYIRLSRPATPVIYNPDTYEFQRGKANIIKDSPRADVALLAIGTLLHEAIHAAELLEADGYSVIVADFASIKPIDKEALVKIAKASRLIVTIEEHSIIGGLGGAVAEVLSEEYPSHMMRIGIMDVFGESGTPAALFKHFGLTADDIYRKVQKAIR